MKIKSGKLLKRVEDEQGIIEVRENRKYRWMNFDDYVFQTLIDKKNLHEPTLGHMPILLNSFNLIDILIVELFRQSNSIFLV